MGSGSGWGVGGRKWRSKWEQNFRWDVLYDRIIYFQQKICSEKKMKIFQFYLNDYSLIPMFKTK